MRDKLTYILLAAGGLFLCVNLYGILEVLPDEASQGSIYRILFFHLPGAITAFLGMFVGMLLSILYLLTGKFTYDALAASVNEVALVFAFINVITGSIWARIIWGIWWTWDYRLTSMFVCLLIYSGYLL